MMNSMMPYFSKNPMALFDDDFFRPFLAAPAAHGNFRVAVRDTGNAYELTAELPGAAREDLSIDLKENVLTISAEWKRSETKSDGWIINERRCGRASRAFNVDGIDDAAITASYADGILTVHLPKKADAPAARKIDIN